MSVLDSIRQFVYKSQFIKSCRAAIETNPKGVVANTAWLRTAQNDRWAHAGGGRYHIFGNSVEAFDDAIASGFSIIEADVMLTRDGVPVMSHRFRPNNEVEFDRTPSVGEFLARRINGKYTPLTFDDFIKRYSNEDVYFAIDPSPATRAEKGADYIMRYLKDHADVRFLRKVIYQLSGVSSLVRFAKMDWPGSLHYNIDFNISTKSGSWYVEHLIPAIKSIGVASVSYVDMPITGYLRKAVEMFSSAGLRVFVASVNSQERFARLKAIGVDGIDTDYLYPTGEIR